MRLTPNRIGRFSISDELLATVGWEGLGTILGKTGMFVVRAEHRLDLRATEYFAFCKIFEEQMNSKPDVPEYRVEVEHKDHVMSIYFRRVS